MFFTPTGPSEPASAPNHSRISSGTRGPELGVAGDGAELRLAQLVIAAQQHQHGLAVRHQHQALHLRGLGQPGEPRPRPRWSCGRACGTPRARGRLRDRRRSARRAPRRPSPGSPSSRSFADRHQVFAGIRRHHELVRLAAAHGAGVRLHHQVFQAAAVEDAAVRVVVLVVGDVQPGLVQVEGVGILHEELAHAQQAGLGARLVAKLGLDLVPDLGKLLVAAQLAAGDGGHHLFVRHAQAQVAPEAVLQAEHVVAHDVPAARFLPDLGRVERRQQHLLRRRWRPSPRARCAGSSAAIAVPGNR